MSDDLERLLKGIPDRVPRARPDVTALVRERVLRSSRPRQPRSTRSLLLVAAALTLVAATGFSAGRWASPTHAASDLTIGVRPDIVNPQQGTPVTLFGTIPNGRAAESVQIEANECGQSGLFHELAGVRTEAQGVWSLAIPGNPPLAPVTTYIETKTVYRARWNGRYSETVTVYARPYLEMRQLIVKKNKPGKRLFAISAQSRDIKYRKKIVLERRVGATDWRRITTVRVSGGLGVVWVRVLRGWVLRARLPEAEAAPCFIGTATSPTKPVR
jgi:hypothetical protein